MLKAVIFDLDGVIIDSKELHYKAWQKFFKKRNIEFDKKAFNKFFGEPNKKTIRRHLNVKDKEARKIEAEKEKIVLGSIKNLKPNPYLLKFLKQLKKERILVGLGTSAPEKTFNIILKKLKIKKYFNITLGEKDVRRHKPAPDIYLDVAKKLKVRPKECIVFEDTSIGIKAAKRAKMKCIAITTSLPRKRLKSANLIIKGFKDINIKKLKEI